jgi:hypothetical protein
MYVKKIEIPGAGQTEIINIEGCSVQVVNLVTFIFDSARIRLDDESSVPLMPESVYCIGRKFSRVEIIGSESMEGQTVELLITSFLQKPFIKKDLENQQKLTKLITATDGGGVGSDFISISLVPRGNWKVFKLVMNFDGTVTATEPGSASIELRDLSNVLLERYSCGIEKAFQDFPEYSTETIVTFSNENVNNRSIPDQNYNIFTCRIPDMRLVTFDPPFTPMPTKLINIESENIGNLISWQFEIMEY